MVVGGRFGGGVVRRVCGILGLVAAHLVRVVNKIVRVWREVETLLHKVAEELDARKGRLNNRRAAVGAVAARPARAAFVALGPRYTRQATRPLLTLGTHGAHGPDASTFALLAWIARVPGVAAFALERLLLHLCQVLERQRVATVALVSTLPLEQRPLDIRQVIEREARARHATRAALALLARLARAALLPTQEAALLGRKVLEHHLLAPRPRRPTLSTERILLHRRQVVEAEGFTALALGPTLSLRALRPGRLMQRLRRIHQLLDALLELRDGAKVERIVKRGCAVRAVKGAAVQREDPATCARSTKARMGGRLEIGDVNDKGCGCIVAFAVRNTNGQPHVQPNLDGRYRRRKDGVARDGERALGPNERRQHRRRVIGGLEHDGETVDAGARALKQELDREWAVVAESDVRGERRLSEDGHGLRELVGRAQRRQDGCGAGSSRRCAGAAMSAYHRCLNGQRLEPHCVRGGRLAEVDAREAYDQSRIDGLRLGSRVERAVTVGRVHARQRCRRHVKHQRLPGRPLCGFIGVDDLPRVKPSARARLGIQATPVDAVGHICVADERAAEGLNGGRVRVVKPMRVPRGRKDETVHKGRGRVERGIGRVGECGGVCLDGVGRVEREAAAPVVKRRWECVSLGPDGRGRHRLRGCGA